MSDPLRLCSVGIPTYNRPKLLAATIEEIRNQSYRNLEIIISDNASPDPEVERIGREAAAVDPRIRYVRQPENIGPSANFDFVLREATGKFFMWAADDDRRISPYIERLVTELESRPSIALCGMETLYVTNAGETPFFPHHVALYEGAGGSRIERIVAMLERVGAANIIYGVYRREALFHAGRPAASFIGPTLNEHPLFALVADKGDVVCLPEIGLFKLAGESSIRGARWELEGGFRPGGPDLSLSNFRYHRAVIEELDRAYQALDLPPDEIAHAHRAARWVLKRHAIQMAVGWKPRRKVPHVDRRLPVGAHA